MVNAAIKSLGDKDFDVSEVNSKLRKISIHVLEDLFQNWS
jgi:hypothetical protein